MPTGLICAQHFVALRFKRTESESRVATDCGSQLTAQVSASCNFETGASALKTEHGESKQYDYFGWSFPVVHRLQLAPKRKQFS